MATLNFPQDPMIGDLYEFASYTYKWDGEKWKTIGTGSNPTNELRKEVFPKLDITNTYAVEALRRSYVEAGYEVVVGSFGTGGVLKSNTDILLNEDDGKGYVWTGTFPKVVAPGTDPAAISGFVMRSDAGLRNELSGESGGDLVYVGESPISSQLAVDVRRFGAIPRSENPTFDSTQAFQDALDYAKANSIGHVKFSGSYNITTALHTFECPRDDGTAYPGWVGSGDANLAAETAYTIPCCLKIDSRVELVADNVETDVLYGDWNISSSPVDLTAKAMFLITAGSKYQGSIRYGLKNFTITQAFIGRIVEGTAEASSEELRFVSVGFPGLIQGVERRKEGNMQYSGCITGDIHGGWWTQRNNTSQNTTYLPPYPATDVWAIGWTDFCITEGITYSQWSGSPFGARQKLFDQFFDTYFFKSANSAKTSAGGRLTNNADASTPAVMPTYYGVVGRARTVISRYGRAIASYVVGNLKTLGCHRTPVFYMGPPIGCNVKDMYIERSGLITVLAAPGLGNYFGIDQKDDYRAANYGIGFSIAYGTDIGTVTLSSGNQPAPTHPHSGLNLAGALLVQKIKYSGTSESGSDIFLDCTSFGTSFTRHYRATESYFFTQPLRFGSESGELFSYTGGNAFAPVLNIAGSAVSTAWAAKQGRYKKVGNICFFKVAFFNATATTFGAGAVTITGMPEAIAAAPLSAANIQFNIANGLTAGITLNARMYGTTLTLYKDSVGTALSGTDLNGSTSNTSIELSGWYFTA